MTVHVSLQLSFVTSILDFKNQFAQGILTYNIICKQFIFIQNYCTVNYKFKSVFR